MPVQITNSLSKKKEDLVPVKGKDIKMYSCGVTVYDKCHIGHARSLYIFDVIKKYLKYRGYNVHFVRNITDIDDKIINKAKELNKTSDEVVEQNIKAYEKDLEDLGIDRADSEPRATKYIPQIISAVQALIEKGFAYAVDGDVYYRVRKFEEYGKLSGQRVDQMEEAVRIDQDDKKKDPLDFALWKKSKEGEPFWESPWGEGRPGWHIECTCMSMKELESDTIDIHAGGRDLIFPHHENEIAQSEALSGKQFAKYWIHHGLLTINAQKMAKSLGNFITVEDALKKHAADDLKMFFLSSHYGSPIDYTEDKIEDAHKALDKFDRLFWKASEILGKIDKINELDQEVGFITDNKNKFIEAMDDDFNTAKALGILFDFITDTNKYIESEQAADNYADVVNAAVNTIEDLSRNVLGLFLKETSNELDEESKQLLEDRIAARAAKDYQKSDELRDLLKEKGVSVEDTKDGQAWRWI